MSDIPSSDDSNTSGITLITDECKTTKLLLKNESSLLLSALIDSRTRRH